MCEEDYEDITPEDDDYEEVAPGKDFHDMTPEERIEYFRQIRNRFSPKYYALECFVSLDSTIIECSEEFAESILERETRDYFRGMRLNKVYTDPGQVDALTVRLARLSLDRPTDIIVDDSIYLTKGGGSSQYIRDFRVICDRAIIDSNLDVVAAHILIVAVETEEQIDKVVTAFKLENRAYRAYILDKRIRMECEMEEREEEERIALELQEAKKVGTIRYRMNKAVNHPYTKIAASIMILLSVMIVAVGTTATWYEQYRIEQVRAEEQEEATRRVTKAMKELEMLVEYWKEKAGE